MRHAKKLAIDLERESASSLIARLVPTRARISVALYDHSKPGQDRAYRGLPDCSALVPVYSARELRRLWSAVRAIISMGQWRDQGVRFRLQAKARSRRLAGGPR